MKDKYVAYVSTYTSGDAHGIRIYDVDMEKGMFCEKDKVEISNSSYITVSHDNKYLYSITDFGLEAYKILPDGELELINFATINGMRGCYISVDYTNQYLFVSGYHDGKLTVLKIMEDGGVGPITDEVYHKGFGSPVERSFRPHINCARMTHDNKYLLVADQGIDHVNVYAFDSSKGKVKLADVIRCDLDSAPRHIKLSKDGRFIYVVHEWKCQIDVYTYEEREGEPYFERIQSISTLRKNASTQGTVASALSFSKDYKYMLSSNAGDNSVIVYNVDQETGMLERNFCLPISGAYPKDVEFFPNNEYLVSLNHESNSMTFFKLDLEKGIMTMNTKPLKISEPNCIRFYKLPEV